MKKLSIVLLIAASSSLMMNAVAAPKTLSAKEATPLVLNYLGATGCPDSDTVDQELLAGFSDASLKVSGYVAAIPADMTCAGGSGTTASTLVFIRTASGREPTENNPRYLKVDPEISQPMAWVNQAPRAIMSLYQKGGQLYATGLEYGKDDSNCCPSIKMVYKVTLKKKSLTISKDEIRDAYTWIFTPTK